MSMKRKFNDITRRNKSYVPSPPRAPLQWLMVVEKSGQTQRDITALRGELEEAKLERGQKVQYDEFTRNLLKKTPKSRSEQMM